MMEDIEKFCMRCKRKISEQPGSGFHTIILYGPEYAWNSDREVKDFVIRTLEKTGYGSQEVGLAPIGY